MRPVTPVRARTGALAVTAGALIAMLGGAIVASAASLGPVSGALMADSAGVTYSPTERRASAIDLTLDASGERVTAATITVIGADLSALAGQRASLVLLDAAGGLLSSDSLVLGEGSALVVAGSTATFRVPIVAAPLRTATASWAVVIEGSALLGPGTQSPRVVTLGDGSIVVVPSRVFWEEQLVPGIGETTELVAVTVTEANLNRRCVDLVISGTTSMPQPWSLELDYSAPPFYGQIPSVGSNAVVGAVSETTMLIVGRSGNGSFNGQNNNAVLTSAQSITVRVCLNGADAPPDRPEAYELGPQTTELVSATRACASRTVTGTGLYPFLFGWSADVDLQAAAEQLLADNPDRTLSLESPDGSAAAGGDTGLYTVSSTGLTSLSGSEQRVVDLCIVVT